jgi:ABC-type multidrug transport system fused ATPase/permease subunit
MKAKDARVKVITEALSNVISLKMSGLEGAVLNASGEHREKELRYLVHRKYLDAVCVFLWALTPVIVPFVTFLSTVYLNVDLTASEVVTALALLNMLIFPMNALPWVINGFMEARVSLRRLAKVLTSENGETLFVNNRFVRKNRHKVKFIDAKVFIPTDAADGGWDGGNGVEAASGRSALRTSSSLDARGRGSTGSGSGSSRGRQVSRGGRQPSGEERRGELVLSIPATVWSWATAQQLREMHGSDTFEV